MQIGALHSFLAATAKFNYHSGMVHGQIAGQNTYPVVGSSVFARVKATRRIRRHITSRSLAMFCAVGGLITVLSILAILEYQWAGVVSEANREEARAKLLVALTGIRADVNGMLLSLREDLKPASLGEPAALYARRVDAWRQSAPRPDLVANIYTFASASGRLLEWNRISKEFTAALRPRRFAPLMANLSNPARLTTSVGFSPEASFVWILAGNTPVLISPFSSWESPASRAYFWLELQPQVLERYVFPRLFQRRFGSEQWRDYRICVLSGRTGRLLYESGSDISSGAPPYYDAKLTLLGESSAAPRASDFWELAAAHRHGSLGAIVTRVRRRWLLINSGVLLVLALGMATITGSVLRAQAFLRLQMEFVASVSHELRTPLSVIGSAADNLAEGVVRSDASVREYGSLIRSECRRLSGLVEQTLRFAAGKADYRSRNVCFLRVADVIDKTLAEQAAVIDASGFTVEKNIDPGLPMIRIDRGALSECLLNLVSNAIKYGGENRWCGIRVQPLETGRGTGVQITVADRGQGIPAEEISHIFEPFYRGRAARAAQIRGTGLGLSLAQEAATSMGARITVESVLGQGSAFTIHVPAAFMNSSTIPVEAMVES